MINFCLDTNVIINIFRGNEETKKKLKNILNPPFKLQVPTPVLCELFKGAFISQKKDNAVNLIEQFLLSTDILKLDKNSCKIFGQKHAELKEKGKQTQEFDLMIASITIANDSILLTQNYKDFKNIEGLKVVSV